MPTLVTFFASLSQFHRPLNATTIPKSPEPSSASNEETIDRAWSYLMEGMYLLNEVSSHTKARTELIASH